MTTPNSSMLLFFTPFHYIVARFVFVEIEILSYALILAKNRMMTYG
jgi:hypothetical protein